MHGCYMLYIISRPYQAITLSPDLMTGLLLCLAHRHADSSSTPDALPKGGKFYEQGERTAIEAAPPATKVLLNPKSESQTGRVDCQGGQLADAWLCSRRECCICFDAAG